MSTMLVRHIGQLCTCDPSRGPAPGVVDDAALLAVDGVVAFAGAEADLDAGSIPTDATVLDAHANAVVPGFVDAHTHAVWLGDRAGEYAERSMGRTYEEIAAGGGGIAATVRATAAGSIDDLAAAAAERVRSMRAHGTTTVEIKSGYGLDHAAEIRQLEAARSLGHDPALPDVVTTYLPLHAVPERDRDEYIEHVCAHGVADAAGRAAFVDAYCDVGAYTVDECRRVLNAGRDVGLRAKLHADQHGRSGGALLAAECEAVSADHLDYSSDDDLRALADAAVVGVIIPGASLVLGGPPPPGRRLLEAGCRVAIATDCNPGTCYSESMPLMVSLAVATAGLSAAHALVAATAGGAAALGLRDRGVLRPGMRCDAVILGSPSWLDVAYHLGGDVVRSVIRAGKVIAETV